MGVSHLCFGIPYTYPHNAQASLDKVAAFPTSSRVPYHQLPPAPGARPRNTIALSRRESRPFAKTSITCTAVSPIQPTPTDHILGAVDTSPLSEFQGQPHCETVQPPSLFVPMRYTFSDVGVNCSINRSYPSSSDHRPPAAALSISSQEYPCHTTAQTCPTQGRPPAGQSSFYDPSC